MNYSVINTVKNYLLYCGMWADIEEVGDEVWWMMNYSMINIEKLPLLLWNVSWHRRDLRRGTGSRWPGRRPPETRSTFYVINKIIIFFKMRQTTIGFGGKFTAMSIVMMIQLIYSYISLKLRSRVILCCTDAAPSTAMIILGKCLNFTLYMIVCFCFSFLVCTNNKVVILYSIQIKTKLIL
jgi:hypothetical protein